MALNTHWLEPSSVAEASELLATAPGRARAVAGCTGLSPLALTRDPQIEVAVDLLGIAELQGVEREGEELRIGAVTTLRRLRELEAVPLAARCARGIADEVLQAQATVGGNLAMRGNGAQELATVVVALGGSVELAGGGERRLLDAERLCDPALHLAPGELIAAVRLPLAGAASGYAKLSTNAGAYAVGSVAAHRPDGGGPRVVVNPGSGIPVRLTAVEQALVAGGSGEELAAAAAAALSAVATSEDALASAEYRRRALAFTVMQAIEEMETSTR